MQRPLEPGPEQWQELAHTTVDFLTRFLTELPAAPSSDFDAVEAVLADPALRRPPAEQGRPLTELLDVIGRAAGRAGRSGGRRAEPLHRAGLSGARARRVGGRSAAMARRPVRVAGCGGGHPDLRWIAGHVLGARRRPQRPAARESGPPRRGQGRPAGGLSVCCRAHGRHRLHSAHGHDHADRSRRRGPRWEPAAVLRRGQCRHHEHRSDRPATRDRRVLCPRGSLAACRRRVRRCVRPYRPREAAAARHRPGRLAVLDPHKGFFLPSAPAAYWSATAP